MTPVYKLSASSIKGRTNYGSMLAGNPTYTIPTSFESIATVTVGSGGASSVEFTSIPSTYTHLQVRGITRCTLNGAWTATWMRFNTDSSSGNYITHYLTGDGANVESSSRNLWGAVLIGQVPGTTAGANTMGATITDILDYANTNKNKTTRALGGVDNNGSGEMTFASGLWMSTTAINAIKIYPFNLASNFAQYTTFALYGIKGA